MLEHKAATVDRRVAPAVAPIAFDGFELFTAAALFEMEMFSFFIPINCPSAIARRLPSLAADQDSLGPAQMCSEMRGEADAGAPVANEPSIPVHLSFGDEAE